MPAALGGPRVLLRRLREIMAEPVSAQARLDRIVILIAANMVAEVCPLRHARRRHARAVRDGRPEPRGRPPHHHARGRGLVGLIASTAEPLSLSDAQSHPAFSYKPETGEEIYHAFLGAAAAAAGNARRPRGAEPHLSGLRGRGDRGAPDDRHGARRDDRLGRAPGAGPGRCRHRAASAGAPAGRSPTASASATWFCTSPGSS